MSGKLLKNQIILWPASAEYYVHRWFLPASLKAGKNDRKITKTNTDCNYRHSLEPCALRISMPVGASRLISSFFHLILYYSDIFNFYLLPETLRDFFFPTCKATRKSTPKLTDSVSPFNNSLTGILSLCCLPIYFILSLLSLSAVIHPAQCFLSSDGSSHR